MDNKIIPTPLDQNEQKSRAVKIAFLGTGFVTICLLFIIAFIGFRPDQLSQSDRYFPSPTATNTRTPTVTPSPTLTPTPTPNVTATVQALISIATNEAGQSSILLSDTFDTNANDWTTGSDEDEYADINRQITDGKYSWSATANKGFIAWIDANTKDLTDFSVSVDAYEAQQPGIGEYGILFRQDRDGNFYYFGINSDQEFFVFLNHNDDWKALIDPKFSKFIRAHVPNRMTVVAKDSHFLFFINDHFIGELTDETLSKGIVSLAVSMYRAEDKSVFEFDNFQLRSP